MTRKIAFLAATLAILVSTIPAEAQQDGKVFRIGYLSRDFADQHKILLASFRQGLKEVGYVEGKNIVIEQRYARGKSHRLAALAAELVRLKVDIIVAGGRGGELCQESDQHNPHRNDLQS